MSNAIDAEIARLTAELAAARAVPAASSAVVNECGDSVRDKHVAVAPRPSRYTIRRAIVILADAAAHDGQVLVAARRLGMYPTKASALALRAFFDDTAIQDGDTRQRLACGAAEALMRQGWLP